MAAKVREQSMRASGGGAGREAGLRAVLAAAIAAAAVAVAAGCGPEAPGSWVDVPAMAEELRAANGELAATCGEGFPGYVRGASRRLAARGAGRGVGEALEAYLRPGRGLDPARAPRPDLLRLLVHRFALTCHGARAASRVRRLGDAAGAGAGAEREGRALVAALESVLGELEAAGAGRRRATGAAGAAGAGSFVFAVPASEADGGARAVAALPVVLLACVRCRSGTKLAGERQVAAAAAALEALVATGLRRRHPIELVVCPDAADEPERCARGAGDPERPVAAAVALDGSEPLVVAWSAAASWRLELPHDSPEVLRRAVAVRRPAGRAAPRGVPFILDVGAAGSLDALPAAAWMDLYDPQMDVTALRAAVAVEVEAFAAGREGARFEVTAGEGVVRVTARSEPLPSWEIMRRQNALWDLAALVRSLRVADPPGGGAAALLRALSRFDGDPYGARLGMHYEDPVGGPLLVAPCTLETRGGRVVAGLRLHRPPGLGRAAFVARVEDARSRLGLAVGREIVTGDLVVGEPSRVAPADPRVALVRRALAEVSDDVELPEPTGSPRPGLGALVPDAVAIGLPLRPSPVSEEPALSLVVELLWQLVVATDPAVREASSWE